jgi:hypothetical protein
MKFEACLKAIDDYFIVYIMNIKYSIIPKSYVFHHIRALQLIA